MRKTEIGLEKAVREALIEQRADELVNYASTNQEYKIMVVTLIESMYDSLVRSAAAVGLFGSEVSEEEITAFKEELKNKNLPQLLEQLDNPEQLRKQMYEQAKNEGKSAGELKAEATRYLAKLEEQGISSGAVEKFQEAYRDILDLVEFNDKLVQRLVAVAQTEGFAKATQKETRYEIIREMFPTLDAYRQFVKQNQTAVQKFYNQAQSAFTVEQQTVAGDAVASLLSSLCGAMKEATKKAQEMSNSEYLEKMIKEIYP